MHLEQRQRTHDLLTASGIRQALFANPHTVTWLTGFAPPVQLGNHLFAGGPPLVWYDDGHFTLIILDAQASAADGFDQQPGCALQTYGGYTIEQPIRSAANLAAVLGNVLGGATAAKVGFESQHLTAHLDYTLRQRLHGADEWIPIDGWLAPWRMVKTAEELTILRRAFALTDVGHQAARQAVQSGVREIDVWTAIHSAVERAAGHRVPMGNDCVVGYRENNIGGWPADRELRNHDSLIVDLSVLWEGYWSDSCATYYAGEPTAQQTGMHRTIANALDYAISLVRPGVLAGEIDRKVRQFVADAGNTVYPHHTGHGVGVSGHEEPRIVPDAQITLQAGMVILLEPGSYMPGQTGVRLEDAVLVTSGGAELLTHHDKGL